jgi:hypothetical protein
VVNPVRRDLIGTAEQALAARSWILRLLASGADNPPPPSLTPAGWTLCLDTERCAAAVHARLSATRSLDLLQPELRRVLEQRRMAELKRILSARGQLQQLSAVAARLPEKIVVLKGGVHVQRGGLFDLLDVDLLTTRDQIPHLVGILESEGGYLAESDHAAVDQFHQFHWAPRFRENGIPLEIHFRVHGFAEMDAALTAATRIEGSALHRLTSEDHFYHLLYHTSLQHAFARGRIRDLLVLGEAVADCTSAEIERVLARFEEVRDREVAGRLLHFVQAVQAGTANEDPFRSIAAVRFLASSRKGEWTTSRDTERHTAILLVAGSNGEYRRYLASLLRPGGIGSPAARASRLAKLSGSLSLVAVGGYRFGRAVGVLPRALQLARRARRLSATVTG